MQTLNFRAMHCAMRAMLESELPEASAALAEVPAWFVEWEHSLSRFDPASELNALNAHSGEWVLVSETVWQVLQAALQAASASNGLVRPDLLKALEAAGYTQSFETIQEQASGPYYFDSARQADWEMIQLDAPQRAVRLPAGLMLDFGGVAKGWCADMAVSRLSQWGPALVDAGGDVAVAGVPRQWGGWPVEVSSPFGSSVPGQTLCLVGGGVATSGRDYRHWKNSAGAEQHHLIDPRTGQPAVTDVLTATVIAANARQAETGAKAAFLLGSKAGLAWLEARHLAGCSILADGQTRESQTWNRFIWN
jgi:FAD:protein FMN transferase